MKTKLFSLVLIFFMNVMFMQAQQFDYGANWIKISFDELGGLPQSALTTSSQILVQAQKEKNYPQFLKAFIYKMKFRSMIDNEAFVLNLKEAEAMTDSASFPVKPVLHSMVAEMYWWYLENNRYKFYNRSRTAQFDAADLTTWDLYRLTAKVIEHYKASLLEKDRQKLVKLESFSDMLEYYNSDKKNIRPTLYDFLALRAIDFFKNDEPNLTHPANEFSMNNDAFFLPADAFCNLTIETTDTLAFKFYAISMFQDLLNFHLNDSIPEALIDIDLVRLDFVNQYSTNSAKDSLYLTNLYLLEKKCHGRDVEAKIGLKIASNLYTNGLKYDVHTSENHKWDKKKAFDKCQTILTTFPKYKNDCKALMEAIGNKNIGITIEKENIANEPFRALLEYRNTDSVFVKVIKTSIQEYENVKVAYTRQNKNKYTDWTVYLLDYFGKKATAPSFQVKLPNDRDYQTHYAEIKMPALDKGLYFIMAGTNATMAYKNDMVNFGLTFITNLSYINRRNHDGTNDFYVIDRKTGAPLQGVKAECFYNKYNPASRDYSPILEATSVSDKEGFIHISEKNVHHEAFFLNFFYNDDQFTTRDFENFYRSGNFYNATNYETDFKRTSTFFFTDRSIYRPGQTIYFKGIVIKTDGNKDNSIVTHYACKVALHNANRQQVSEVNVTTNDFGSFSGSFTAPSSGMNGEMSIENETGSISFSVEDYKRPKFEVKYDSIKESFKLGEMVNMQGKAVAYSGASIDNAIVKYRVVRQTRFLWWPYWWRNPQPLSPEKEITQGTTTTGSKGEFEIKFKAVPDETVDPSTNPTFRFTIYTDVTDVNGETHSARKTINAGYKALMLKAEIPDKIDIHSKPEYKITTQNPNEDFVAATGSMVIYKLKSPEKVFRERKWAKADQHIIAKDEYYKTFPADPYDDELNPATWEMLETVLKTSFNTAKEKIFRIPDLKTWHAGVYKLVIQSKDQYGKAVEDSSYFTVFDKDAKTLPYPMADWYQVLTNTAEPGDTAQILSGTDYNNCPFLVEVELENQVVFKEWIMHDHEQHLFSHLIKEEYRGNIGVHYTFIRNNRLYMHNSTIQVPFTNKMLDINFETFRDKLMPGEKDQWRLRVKGKSGDKAAAEMVATLYDASLDVFQPQSFYFSCWPIHTPSLEWQSQNCFQTYQLHNYTNSYDGYQYNFEPNRFTLKWFGYGYRVYNNPVNLEDELKTRRSKANFVILSSAIQKGTEITGSIYDSKGNPLQDIIVLIAGTKTGTMTDLNGKFKISSNLTTIKLLVGSFGQRYYSQELLLNQKGKVDLKIVLRELMHTTLEFVAPQITEESVQDAMFSVNGADVQEAPSINKRTTSQSAGYMKSDKVFKVRGVGSADNSPEPKPDLSSIQARTNLNETAFFYPHLQTDENGDVLINFTIPEALTRWKMLAFAHTKDLKYGFAQNELVTQKDLMVTPNAPRFFRENDTMTITAKVTSLSDKDLNGSAQLMLFDALTMKPVDVVMHNKNAQQPFAVKKGESTNLNWNIMVPSGLQAVTYRVVAQAGKFSDGEESSLPVLTNNMLVTETLPLSVRGRQTKTFTLEKLVHNTSTTLRNHKLTLEFTSNPAWYAIQALPYLMEYPYECAEQTFSRFYANSIASHIANSSPRIKQVFDSWRNMTPDALLSNLEKNPELKNLTLEETPWVTDAKDESERKRRVALLFDLNRMSNELGRALDKLQKMQASNGGWPWFEGMPDNRYITQHIVCGMGKLDHLGVTEIRKDSKTWEMVSKAIAYTDGRITEDYDELKRMEKAGKLVLSDNHTGYTEIHYLYARSFFTDVSMSNNAKEARDYYLSQVRKYWLKNNFYMQGMIALALNRYNDVKTPVDIIKSFKEHAIVSDEMGMYWKSDNGWFWYQAPVETQALMIEAFDEVAHDTTAVNDMKVWLLKQKQTQDWKTTKATIEACYALLLSGDNWLASDNLADITIGNRKVDPRKMPDIKVEAGSGYFKTSWTGQDITPDMGKVTVTKKDNGVSWGAVYWQYFEQLDKITAAETPLKIKKQLFVERNTSAGPVIQLISDTTHLKPGDLLKVRIELRVDREMEYVHMKDMRAAGLEPTNVISQYKYQDGLGYYESTRDAATNFFFGWLPKGTYVFEYPLRVTHYGNFSNGITTIQCMYAPEFMSHSEGVRVKIK